jgi:hypothetical protein
MIDAWIVFRRGLGLWRRHIIPLTLASLAWAALSLTILLLPPATAGLYAFTNRIAYGEPPHAEHFFAGARRYSALSFQWALVNLAAGGLFYAGLSTGDLPGLARFGLMLALGGWIAVQFYTWPLLLEAPRKRLFPALRTALLLALAAPFFTPALLWAAALTVLAATEIAAPLGLLVAGFVALVGNLAVIDRLAAFGRAPDPRSARLH